MVFIVVWSSPSALTSSAAHATRSRTCCWSSSEASQVAPSCSPACDVDASSASAI